MISTEESEFIEKFSAEIEIPHEIPSWLWGGKITFNKHPTLKLKFKDPGMNEQFEQKQQQKKNVADVDDNQKGVNGNKKNFFCFKKKKGLKKVVQ